MLTGERKSSDKMNGMVFQEGTFANLFTGRQYAVFDFLTMYLTLIDPLGIQCTETSPSGNYSDTVEGEQITLECQISFFGLWGPTQSWTDSQGKMLTPIDLSTDSTVRYVNTVRIIPKFQL